MLYIELTVKFVKWCKGYVLVCFLPSPNHQAPKLVQPDKLFHMLALG